MGFYEKALARRRTATATPTSAARAPSAENAAVAPKTAAPSCARISSRRPSAVSRRSAHSLEASAARRSASSSGIPAASAMRVASGSAP